MGKLCEWLGAIIRSPWCGRFLAFVVLFFLIVPGDSSRQNTYDYLIARFRSDRLDTLDHGWPLWFLNRGGLWGPWGLTRDVEDFRPTALAFDVVVAALCIAAAGRLWRNFTSERRSLLRFRLATFLVVVTVIGLILAAWTDSYRRYSEAQQWLGILREQNADRSNRVPLWLDELGGHNFWDRLGLAEYYSIPVTLSDDLQEFEALKRLTALYPRAVYLIVENPPKPATASRLIECSNIERGCIRGGASLKLLDSFPRIIEVRATLLGPHDSQFLANRRYLRVLTISAMQGDYCATDEDLANAVQGLASLEELEIRGVCIHSQGISCLRTLPRLCKLTIHACPIDDEVFAELPAIPRLRQLKLIGTGITGDGIGQLAKCRYLQSLWIEFAALSDSEASQLGYLKQLRELCLVATRITETTFESLKSLPKLNALAIDSDGVQNANAFFGDSFPSLTTLVLKHTSIDDQELIQLHKVRPRLELYVEPFGAPPRERVHIHSNSLGEMAVEIRPTAHTPEDVPESIEVNDVEDVNIRTRDFDPWFEWLASLPNLRKLSLSDTVLTEQQLKRLVERCPLLDEVNLSDTRLTAAEIQSASGWKKMKQLTIDPSQVAGAAELIPKLPGLFRLRLSTQSSMRKPHEYSEIVERLRKEYPKILFPEE